MVPDISLDQLVEQYKAAVENKASQRELAELEAMAWQLTTAEDRRGSRQDAFVARCFGAKSYEAGNRAILWNSRSEAAELWERVERDEMPTRTAACLLRTARRVALNQGVSTAFGVTLVLKDYDQKPISHTKDGKPFRRRPSPVGARSLREPGKPEKAATLPKNGWHAIEQHAQRLVQDALLDVAPAAAEPIWKTFLAELRILVSDTQAKVQRAGKRNRLAPVTRRDVLTACEALGMDPPNPGDPVDLDEARRKKKAQIRVYHPDANGGDDRNADRMNAAVEAFNLLERYETERKAS